MADMFIWFNDVGYSANIAALRQDFKEVNWLNFKDWLALQDWSVLS